MRSKLLALFVALAFTTLACEQILGLDKFQRCDPGACDAASEAGETDASDAGDASDAFVIPDGVSEASSWPRWRIENSAIEVQNGATDASLASYTVGGGVLVDDVTQKQLVWKTQLGFASTIDAAVAFCASLGARLPTRIEVVTLLDSTRKNAPYTTPAFDAVLMPDGSPPPGTLWTSSYARPVTSPLRYWLVDVQHGNLLQDLPSANMGVVCVQ